MCIRHGLRLKKPVCEEDKMGHFCSGYYINFLPADLKLKHNLNTEFLILVCDKIHV